jgi:Yip1 domain
MQKQDFDSLPFRGEIQSRQTKTAAAQPTFGGPMPDTTAASPELTAPPLTEVQRVVDTFTAPPKTFTDILRKATFWGPLVVMILVTIIYSFSVQQKVGWDKVFENNLHQSPKQEERFTQMPPDQAASAKAISAKITAIVSYCYPVLALLFTAIFALLVWVTVNFGFAGTAKFGQIFAVNMYANLVMNIKFLLAAIALFAGVAADSFLISNPVGTNVGYYLSPETPKPLMALCTHIDIFEIWSVLLTTIGVAVVAKVSRGKAAAVVVGWWVIVVLVLVGIAAAS